MANANTQYEGGYTLDGFCVRDDEDVVMSDSASVVEDLTFGGASKFTEGSTKDLPRSNGTGAVTKKAGPKIKRHGTGFNLKWTAKVKPAPKPTTKANKRPRLTFERRMEMLKQGLVPRTERSRKRAVEKAPATPVQDLKMPSVALPEKQCSKSPASARPQEQSNQKAPAYKIEEQEDRRSPTSTYRIDDHGVIDRLSDTDNDVYRRDPELLADADGDGDAHDSSDNSDISSMDVSTDEAGEGDDSEDAEFIPSDVEMLDIACSIKNGGKGEETTGAARITRSRRRTAGQSTTAIAEPDFKPVGLKVRQRKEESRKTFDDMVDEGCGSRGVDVDGEEDGEVKKEGEERVVEAVKRKIIILNYRKVPQVLGSVPISGLIPTYSQARSQGSIAATSPTTATINDECQDQLEDGTPLQDENTYRLPLVPDPATLRSVGHTESRITDIHTSRVKQEAVQEEEWATITTATAIEAPMSRFKAAAIAIGYAFGFAFGSGV